MADAYRARGVRVVAGRPHATYWQEEALQHVDPVVAGEADAVWPAVLEDVARGTSRRVYRGEPSSMQGLPTPRYDPLEPRFLVPRVPEIPRESSVDTPSP